MSATKEPNAKKTSNRMPVLWVIKTPKGGYAIPCKPRTRTSAIQSFSYSQKVAWHLLKKIGYIAVKVYMKECTS